MPVYLICEIFKKKYVFGKNSQKIRHIRYIRKAKNSKKQQKKQKKGGKEMPGHTGQANTAIPVINTSRNHFLKGCMNWQTERGFSVTGIHHF